MVALRLAAVVIAAVALTAGADGARSALFFFFDPTTAKPGDRVAIRTAGTPRGFRASERVRPLQRPMRVYLVENATARELRSRLDSRLHFVGSLVPDARGRGILTFTVPPLDSGSYAAAVWCPSCARYSHGRTFFVLGVGTGTVGRYRPLMLLHVNASPATADACPVTMPNGSTPPGLSGRTPLGSQRGKWHGNGGLWTGVPSSGVFRPAPPNVAPDGSIGAKWYWWAAGVDEGFVLRGQRLDAPSPPLVVHRVNRGSHSGFRGSATWATPITFPTEGCWEMTARVEDVSLSFVIKLVRP